VWNDFHEFKDVPFDAQIEVVIFDEDLMSDDLLGTIPISLAGISKVPPGQDWSIENWFLLGSDKSPNAKVKLRFEFKFKPLPPSAAPVESKKASQPTSSPIKTLFSSSSSSAGSAPPLEPAKSSSGISNIFAALSPKTDPARGKEYFGQPIMTQYQLRAHIYQARQLEAADLSGLSDPFIVVRCAGQSVQTSIKEQTLNPVYYSTKCLSILLPNPLSLAPNVVLNVFDNDLLGKTFLGRLSVPISMVQSMNPSIDELDPKWFELADIQGNPGQGSVLVSFQLFPMEMSTLPLPILKPKSVPMTIEISTLGLRSLSSVFGVNKPLIEFELPNGKKFKTNASAKPSSKNPNFLQVSDIPISVPVDTRYAPALNVNVIDNILGGFFKRRIGGSCLMLENYMEKGDDGEWKTDKRFDVLDEVKLEEEIKTIQDDPPEPSRSNFDISSSEVIHENDKAGLLSDEGKSMDFAEIKVESKEHQALENKDDDDDEEDHAPLLVDVKMDDAYTHEWGEKVSNSETVPKFRKNREVFEEELEAKMLLKPFDEISLFTGSKKAGLFSTGVRKVGLFKGLVRLTKDKSVGSPIDKSELLCPKDVFVRLYVLCGKSLTGMDSNGKSDPYLVVSLGKEKVSLRSKYISGNCNPDFYESFEFASQIPGPSELKIDVWDWDGIGDDLIGTTSVDVEDRWFCKSWRQIKKKPIEWRTLYNPSSSMSQGMLELWVDVYDSADAKKFPMVNIAPPPKEDWELRVIVWQCKEVTIKDEITQQNDLYITGLLDTPGQKRKKTDVHLRSKGGKGSFNWRMKYPLQLPMKLSHFSIQIWDMDFFSANDSICEVNLSLKAFFEKAYKVKDRIKMVKDGKDRIWIEDLRHPNEPGKSQGSVEVSFELLPKSLTVQYPAGDGRSDPNMNPVLPPPEGRLEWMKLLMNPFALLKEILGDRLYYKVCIGFCISTAITFVIYFFPTIFANLLAKSLVG
jgi:hypothetical protein